MQGWRFLALVLTSQERHAEADVVLESALEVATTSEQGPLLRTRAKVQMALGQPLRAVKCYQSLLALLRTQQKQRELGAGIMGKVSLALPCPALLLHSISPIIKSHIFLNLKAKGVVSEQVYK